MRFIGRRRKRALDLSLALLILVLISVPLLLIAAAVRWSSEGPVLFRQKRIGRNGVEFDMFKFRSMNVGCDDRIHREMNTRELQGDRHPPGTDAGSFLLQHDPRITNVGRFLRKYSLDEFPQLFNVLRGEMSLVGPRPAIAWEVALFKPEHLQRHDCLPGMTGLWQVVNKRYELSMLEMLDLDVTYVNRRSLALDLLILLRTPFAVLFDRGMR